MASQVKTSAWLEWAASLMGAGSRQTYAACLPSNRFYCLLDELPLHLIPRRDFELQDWRKQAERQLIFSPRCSVLRAGTVPEEFKSRSDLLDGFHLESSIAWVREPTTSALLPFWLGPRLQAVIAGMRAGDSVPDSIPAADQALLAAAGIFELQDEAAHPLAEREQLAQEATKQFFERGYWPIRNLIHPFHIAALRRYYRQAIRAGSIRLGDQQSSRRYVAHNESVARFFHHQIANAVAPVAGEAIKPSYVYLASYLSGAALKKHIDRAQCEFSVTLCLDFSPEPNLETSWPIHLDTPKGTVTVYQALGDGLVYRGTEVPHYRSPLAAGHTSTSIFFHYVPADFTGPLD
jgi:hypothetical protein